VLAVLAVLAVMADRRICLAAGNQLKIGLLPCKADYLAKVSAYFTAPVILLIMRISG
jgi:hypothetical protein